MEKKQDDDVRWASRGSRPPGPTCVRLSLVLDLDQPSRQRKQHRLPARDRDEAHVLPVPDEPALQEHVAVPAVPFWRDITEPQRDVAGAAHDGATS